MAKLTRFAIAPDGRIVYRDTGRVAKGNLTTKIYANGQIGVYRNGRRVGMVGKPTKAQQDKINKLAHTRQVKAERKAIKEVTTADTVDAYISAKPNGWQNARDLKVVRDTFPVVHYKNGEFHHIANIPPLTVQQQGEVNFGSYLQNEVDRGNLTIEEANDLWDEYISGNDDERSRLWEEAHKRDTEEGYRYLEASPSDLKKALRAMGFNFMSIR